MSRVPRSILLIVISFSFVASSGCYHYSSGLPGTIRQASPSEYRIIGSFSVELERRWWLWGLAKLRQDDIDQKVRAAVRQAGGDGAANVQIITESDGGDIVFGLLNLLLPCGWHARHMVIKGEVIRFNE